MTEEIIESEAPEVEEAPPEPLYCRHCGQPAPDDTDATTEWQCSSCDQHQDTMACPTCHQPARISLLSAELVTAPHAPARRRKG